MTAQGIRQSAASGARHPRSAEIEAEATAGFVEGDIGVVRDNARQLKFKAELTGFKD